MCFKKNDALSQGMEFEFVGTDNANVSTVIVWRDCEIILGREAEVPGGRICASATSSTTNPT